jgi:DNA-binding NarL/FixJ family response regulator
VPSKRLAKPMDIGRLSTAPGVGSRFQDGLGPRSVQIWGHVLRKSPPFFAGGPLRILVVDDHDLFREGLLFLLAKLDQPVEVDDVGTCEEALELVESRGAPDLALVDLKLPGMSGFEGLQVLRARHPDLPVVVLSSYDDPNTVMRALDLGAMGFIPKSTRVEQMLAALKLVLAKGIYLPASVLLGKEGREVLPLARTQPLASALPNEGTWTTPGDLGLTKRQAEVLYLILQGKASKSIARELDLAPATVKSHTSAVLRALNVTTRTQAIVAASRLRLRFS